VYLLTGPGGEPVGVLLAQDLATAVQDQAR
jgi:hypothetical protein